MSTFPSSDVGTAAVQIAAVELAKRGERLHANLERPGGDEPTPGFCVPLAGWALAPDGADVAIEVCHGQQVLCRLARGVDRPDIVAAFPGVPGAERSGFSAVVEVLKLPRAFDLRVNGIVGDAETVPIARVRGVRRAFEPQPAEGPAPLMMTTLGRSGSTLLMTLLSHHPQIVAFNPANDDARPFAYQLDAAIGMASPASRMRLLDSAVQGEAWWLGRDTLPVEALVRLDEPLRELLLGAPVERLLRSAIDQAAAFATELGAAQGQTDVRYAAEKCGPAYLPRLMRELCADGREIFLVRDFRDVIASMLAFNAKRGYDAFGREHVDSDEQFVRWQAGIAAAIAAGWRERRDGALLVRYEDLVADEPGGARPDPRLPGARRPRVAGRRRSSMRAHAPTETASSIARSRTRARRRGRWRTDLPPALKELADEAFADPLQEFGYA